MERERDLLKLVAPWEFEFPFPGSLTSTFLNAGRKQGMERERELLKLVDKMQESRQAWETRAPDT